MTCGACPEQYDAFLGDKQVGYLRLRHGHFRVDYPDVHGDLIYEADTVGDGVFSETERVHHLERAKQAIVKRLTDAERTEALVPCFKCGKTLMNVVPNQQNQPSDGTEFRTYGHYGSTFWDSFDGEELILNVCDDCLRENTKRLAQHRRYQKMVECPMEPYKEQA